jgi:hypothetical protein
MVKWMLVSGCAVIIVVLARDAAAEGFNSTEEEMIDDPVVDWEEAEEWAELVDVVIEEDGVKREIYLDDVQGLMWELIIGPDGFVQERLPTMTVDYLMWWNPSQNTCYRSTDCIYYISSPARRTYLWGADIANPNNVEQVRGRASTTSITNKCNCTGCDYTGFYYDFDTTDWEIAQYDPCYYSPSLSRYLYFAEEWSEVDDYDYSTEGIDEVVQFEYYDIYASNYYWHQVEWQEVPE